ncbi:MAG: TetR/AcrR family transcriptional regulator [Planctomycetes bacterium]|nr:TetR/AcrR family transcriptional regulator [Planctomycetota bacterium]
MPRVPDASLRDRLVAAAIRVFAGAGYAAATLDRIAAEAGVTKGGIYFHFQDKEELFFAALDAVRAAQRAAVQGAIPPERTGAGELVAVLGAWFGFHLAETGAARLLGLLAGEVAGRPTAMIRADSREDQRWLRSRIRQALVKGVADGTLDVRDPVVTAFLLAAGAQGIVAQWLTAPADVAEFGSPDSLAESLVEPLRTHAPPAINEVPDGFLPTVGG